MTKIEMLAFGLKHIAENHHLNADTSNWDTNGEMCIWGGCNVPTLQDVYFLMEDLGLPNRFVEESEYGIDVWIPMPEVWDAFATYKKGMEFWRKIA